MIVGAVDIPDADGLTGSMNCQRTRKGRLGVCFAKDARIAVIAIDVVNVDVKSRRFDLVGLETDVEGRGHNRRWRQRRPHQ